MSDRNRNEDSLERLFKKKARDYDISYKEEDWSKLERSLELRDIRRMYHRKLRWIAAASILIITLLGFFTYENYVRLDQISAQLNNKNGQETPRNAADTPFITDSDSIKKTDNGTRNSNMLTRSTRNDETESKSTAAQSAARYATAPDGAESDKITGKQPSNKQNQQKNLTPDKKEWDLFVSAFSCPDCTVSGQTEIDAPPVLSYLRSEQPERDAVPFQAEDSSPQPIASDAKDNLSREAFPRVSIGFVMSPDLSTAGSFSNFSDPGYKFGIIAEYHVGPRLAISTGIIQSKVRYTASGTEYKPPRGFWTNGTVPYETDGVCVLIDLPINLKYNVLQFDRSGLYATAGLSSYIMLDEDYRFNYKRDDPSLVQGWSGKTGTRHWLSNAGFSVGYEWNMHTNWSIRAEPFVKIPLKEVGWGNVNLYSIGSFISINYKL